jgi:tripartite-type tricarboxylate transporter receptor subunit TctC
MPSTAHTNFIRLSLWSLWSLCFILVAPAEAHAQAYPSKPIRFVVPYPPGGPLDTVARLLGQKVSESVKQPVIVDNKPGAGGNIGADTVAKAPPDGYTILMGAVATHAINPTLYASIPYDPIKDFLPVTQLASTPNVLIVNSSGAREQRAGLHRICQGQPGKLNFGSGSTGSAGHPRGRALQDDGGRGDDARPVQGRGACDAGSHRRDRSSSCSTTSRPPIRR